MHNEQLIYLFRIILAGVCGIIIGMERKNRAKEAGIRTHFVVACGAAIMMIVSKYAFFDVIQGGMFGDIDVRLDPSRVASTIASGIGFLGAGMIFVQKNTITGLTTAAGIWATSGVGMAIGAGMYILGIGATLIIIAAQYLLHMQFPYHKDSKIKMLSISGVTEPDYQSNLLYAFAELKINVIATSVENSGDNTYDYIFKIELPPSVREDEILSMINYRSSIKPAQQ